jgi:hypothetical protein
MLLLCCFAVIGVVLLPVGLLLGCVCCVLRVVSSYSTVYSSIQRKYRGNVVNLCFVCCFVSFGCIGILIYLIFSEFLIFLGFGYATLLGGP